MSTRKKKKAATRPVGRPPVADHERRIAVTASISTEDVGFLRAEAQRRDVSFSSLMQEAVKKLRASIERARKRKGGH